MTNKSIADVDQILVPGENSLPISIQEVEQYARKHLPKNAYDYYASGANDSLSLAENRNAFARLRIMPRVMRDVSSINLSTTILGERIEVPVCIAPSAMQRMAHPDGEEATIRATASRKTCIILSSLSTTSIEDVAAAAPEGLRWFQLYIYKDREITRSLVKRAENAGYKAIVLTVDTPLLGQREKDVRNGFKLPSHLKLGNFEAASKEYSQGVKAKGDSGLAAYVASLFDQSICWEDVKWLRSITALPIVVKGVLSAHDAEIAVQLGCQGILVSNHGARQLDTVPATIEVLQEVCEAVKGRAEVYLDGGVRRGIDVFKALAYGAKAVFLGRPALWGLAYKGEEGVAHVLDILRNELRQAMMFAGTNSLEKIKPDLIRPEAYFRTNKL